MDVVVTSAPRLEVPSTVKVVNKLAASSKSKLPEIVKLSPVPSPCRVLANCTVEPVKSKVPLMVTASL